MTNFEKAMECVGQALFEQYDKNLPNEVKTLLTAIHKSYVLVAWPESQTFMDEDWFKNEAIFCGGSEDKTGDSAYFIPINRII